MVSKKWLGLLPIMLLVYLMNPIHGPLVASERETSNEEKRAIIRKLYRNYRKDFPGVVDISAKEARTLLDQEKVVFIDAREPEEQTVSTLPDAVTREMFLKNPGIAQGKTAVAYCTIGYRSGVFSEQMGRQGIDLANLSGGILAWILDGGKVYADERETNRVHVYGKEWNHLPDGYEAVMFGFFKKLVD